MVRRILIPYLSAGLGHYVHAQAIAEMLSRRRPDWEVRLMDVARELDDAQMRRTFVDLWRVILRMPAPLSAVLFGLERLAPGIARRMSLRGFRTAVPKAGAYLAEHPTDLIMSTHWACAHLFAMARGTRDIPIYCLYGELETAYSIAECGADLYFCLSSEVSEGMAHLGIDRGIIRQVPLVVDPAMARDDIPRDAMRKKLGIPPEHFTVVMGLGGEGIGKPLPFIRAFLRVVKGATLIVLTGRNAKLADRIRSRVHSPAVVPLGFQEDLGPVIACADVLAGKVGPGFISVAVAVGVPFIVTHIGAPNEDGSMRFIVKNGHGWHCPRPRMFASKVAELMRERGTAAGSVRSGRAVVRNGAENIAATIVEALS